MISDLTTEHLYVAAYFVLLFGYLAGAAPLVLLSTPIAIAAIIRGGIEEDERNTSR